MLYNIFKWKHVIYLSWIIDKNGSRNDIVSDLATCPASNGQRPDGLRVDYTLHTRCANQLIGSLIIDLMLNPVSWFRSHVRADLEIQLLDWTLNFPIANINLLAFTNWSPNIWCKPRESGTEANFVMNN